MHERKTLFTTIAERRSNIKGHLLHHSNWFTALIKGMIEGHRGKGRPRQKYIDEIKGERKYTELRGCLWIGRNCKPPISGLRRKKEKSANVKEDDEHAFVTLLTFVGFFLVMEMLSSSTTKTVVWSLCCN